MLRPDRVLVHGLFTAPGSTGPGESAGVAQAARTQAFSENAAALGICSYQWLDGQGRALANRFLRWLRGTARTVDAVEILTLQEDALRSSLSARAGRALWQDVASCEPRGIDVTRSFILMGKPIQLLAGPEDGQKVIWFGNGLSKLSRQEFIAHYTGQHGPLVASHAQLIGLRRYQQVPAQQNGLCVPLRELGLGRGPAPAVFAELVMGPPQLRLGTLQARRAATREIRADEKRHIDFHRSMLFLPR